MLDFGIYSIEWILEGLPRTMWRLLCFGVVFTIVIGWTSACWIIELAAHALRVPEPSAIYEQVCPNNILSMMTNKAVCMISGGPICVGREFIQMVVGGDYANRCGGLIYDTSPPGAFFSGLTKNGG
jgi:hypothetical protein